jgi:hypothetical protein
MASGLRALACIDVHICSDDLHKPAIGHFPDFNTGYPKYDRETAVKK